jgi:hypothetical protein
MCGENYGQALEVIPVLSNIVMPRVESVLEDNQGQVLTRFKCPKISLEIDAQQMLQVYRSYSSFSDSAVKKIFVRCHVLASADRENAGSDILKAVNDRTSAWSDCVGICAGGEATLTGHKKGFQAELRPVRLTYSASHHSYRGFSITLTLS